VGAFSCPRPDRRDPSPFAVPGAQAEQSPAVRERCVAATAHFPTIFNNMRDHFFLPGLSHKSLREASIRTVLIGDFLSYKSYTRKIGKTLIGKEIEVKPYISYLRLVFISY